MKLPLPLSGRLAWPRALPSSQADLTVLVNYQVQVPTPSQAGLAGLALAVRALPGEP